MTTAVSPPALTLQPERPKVDDAAPLRAVHTPNVPALLRRLGASLLVTTYQAGKLVMVRDIDRVSQQASERTMFQNSGRDQRQSGRGTAAVRQRQRRRMQPTLLALEERTLLSTFLVTNPADTAPASSPDVNTVRWAVEQADAATSASSIEIELGRRL
jgi:hypothetical protein